ncbi:superinfection immunity protein [Methylosinus sp. Ce-a6]|uniref:superinfection immunity protein n=1 Tax=Methylosinus sp. Ce-a6 TaxID=2172005 RepID=UPI001FCEB383|nr:superinfection immunity protein [Methylosinus sp. Ce-a6]
MIARVLFVSLIALFAFYAHAEETKTVRCYPTVAGAIKEVDVIVSDHIVEVAHTGANGKIYERTSQYHFYETTSDEGYSWEGIHFKKNNIKMVGRLEVAGADGSAVYTELLYDASKGFVGKTEALCPAPPVYDAKEARAPSTPTSSQEYQLAQETTATVDKLAGSVSHPAEASSEEHAKEQTGIQQNEDGRPVSSAQQNKDEASFGVIILFVALIALSIYFLPTTIASSRQHRAIGSIFVINLFLGWTFLFWVLCLAWAFGPNVKGVSPPTSI